MRCQGTLEQRCSLPQGSEERIFKEAFQHQFGFYQNKCTGAELQVSGKSAKPCGLLPLASKETCFLSPRKKIEVLGFLRFLAYLKTRLPDKIYRLEASKTFLLQLVCQKGFKTAKPLNFDLLCFLVFEA